jgi:hypothetical protein
MLRVVIAGAAIGLGAVLLSSCATMSEDQCLAGDWGGQGFRDGSNGLSMSRLDDHAKACAKHGVTPDEIPYRSAREDGLRLYCRPDRGFVEGREGNSYANVCPSDLEAEFLPAYRDGQMLHSAESALESAISSAESYASRLEELDDKIDAKRRECRDDSLSEETRERACERIRELRDEKDSNREDLRRAEDDVRRARSDLDSVRFRLSGLYPV